MLWNMNYRTALTLFIITPALSVGLFAQNTPKLELFGGYSYFGLPAVAATGFTAANLNGWNASAKLNLRPRIGLVADFGGNYGERRTVPTQFQPIGTKAGTYRSEERRVGKE